MKALRRHLQPILLRSASYLQTLNRYRNALRERVLFGVVPRLTIAALAGVGALVLAVNLFVQQRTPGEQIARIAPLTDAAPPGGAVTTNAIPSTNTVASAESV